MEKESGFKRFVLEVSFFLGVALAVVLTVVDVILGIGRYIIGRMRGKSHFNPWGNIGLIWKMIGLHIAYLIRLAQPAFRESIKRNREAMHRRAAAARDAFRRAGDATIFQDFDYIDVETFFAFLWPILTYGWLVLELVLCFIGSLAYPGMKYYASTQKVTTPMQQTKIVYQPQVADKQDLDFGPWKSEGEMADQARNKGFRNLAIVNDTGEIKYSPSKVGDLSGFMPLGFSDRIVNPRLNSDGRIAFHDPHKEEFTVNPYQVFMVESYDSQAFYFNDGGQLFAKPLEQLKFTSK